MTATTERLSTRQIPNLAEFLPQMDLSRSDPEVMLQLAREFEPLLGVPPYETMAMELVSPLGEHNRRVLVDWLVNLSDGRGQQLFIQSPDLMFIHRHQARYHALEAMYTGRSSRGDQRTRHELYAWVWGQSLIRGTHNSMGVRNRGRDVTIEIEREVRRMLENNPSRDIQILGIAAGSSRAVLRAVGELNPDAQRRVHLKLVDSDERIKSDVPNIAAEYRVLSTIDPVVARVAQHGLYLLDGYHPDVVEIVGLFDYLSDGSIYRHILEPLRRCMKPGGVILYSNMDNTDKPGEDRFRDEVVGWTALTMRSDDHVMSLAERIQPADLVYIAEPLGVYHLVKVVI